LPTLILLDAPARWAAFSILTVLLVLIVAADWRGSSRRCSSESRPRQRDGWDEIDRDLPEG